MPISAGYLQNCRETSESGTPPWKIGITGAIAPVAPPPLLTLAPPPCGCQCRQ